MDVGQRAANFDRQDKQIIDGRRSGRIASTLSKRNALQYTST